jgi:hypothetical protein
VPHILNVAAPGKTVEEGDGQKANIVASWTDSFEYERDSSVFPRYCCGLKYPDTS